MVDLDGALASCDWLAAHLGEEGLRVLDVRWAPAGPSPRQRYEAGHVPGALFVHLDADLSRPGGPGRHPLPDEAAFAARLSAWGVAEETRVVAVDDGAGAIAARLWFMLRLAGHARAAVLDGGMAAWRAGGRPVEAGPGRPVPPAPLRRLAFDRARLADREEIARRVVAAPRGEGPLLLDARAAERYRGEVEPLDPRAGHVPGAVSAPYPGSLRAADDPRFLPPAALRARFAALGAETRETIASCGSGVTACHHLLALEVAGLPPGRLYVGSWSDWCSDPAAPVATGEEP